MQVGTFSCRILYLLIDNLFSPWSAKLIHLPYIFTDARINAILYFQDCRWGYIYRYQYVLYAIYWQKLWEQSLPTVSALDIYEVKPLFQDYLASTLVLASAIAGIADNISSSLVALGITYALLVYFIGFALYEIASVVSLGFMAGLFPTAIVCLLVNLFDNGHEKVFPSHKRFCSNGGTLTSWLPSGIATNFGEPLWFKRDTMLGPSWFDGDCFSLQTMFSTLTS